MSRNINEANIRSFSPADTIKDDDQFIKACHDIAKSVFGDDYDHDLTEKTAIGILKDHTDMDYDQKLGFYRNGIKGFSENDTYYVVVHENGKVDSWYGPYSESEASSVEDKLANDTDQGFSIGIWSEDFLTKKLNKQRPDNWDKNSVKSKASKSFSDREKYDYWTRMQNRQSFKFSQSGHTFELKYEGIRTNPAGGKDNLYTLLVDGKEKENSEPDYVVASHISSIMKNTTFSEKREKVSAEMLEKAKSDGVIQKKPNGSWGIISIQAGEWWNADYDTKENAENALKAYHANKSKHFSTSDVYAYTPDELRSNKKKLLSLPSSKKPDSDIVDCNEVLIKLEWKGKGQIFASGINYKKINEDAWRQYNSDSIISTEKLINNLSELYSKHKNEKPLILGFNLGIHNRNFSDNDWCVVASNANKKFTIKDEAFSNDKETDWYVAGIIVYESGDEEVYSAVQPQVNKPTKEDVLEFEPKAKDLHYFKVFTDEHSCDRYLGQLDQKLKDMQRKYSKKPFNFKNKVKKVTVTELAELAYTLIADDEAIKQAFKGYNGKNAKDLARYFMRFKLSASDVLLALANIVEFAIKTEKTFSNEVSSLPISKDPSIISNKVKIEKSNAGNDLVTNLVIGPKLKLGIEPFIVADVISDVYDGMYLGSLYQDKIKTESEEIQINIKLYQSNPIEVIALVANGKVFIFKLSQLENVKSKTFSTESESNYKFSLIPTEIKYDMQHVIGSWMLASSVCHLFHICDQKYAGHVALDEFYKGFPEYIDALAEHFLSDNSNAYFRVCIVPNQCPIEYLTNLIKFTLEYVNLHKNEIPSSYQSQIDDITNFTQGILYKLKRLDSGKKLFSFK